MNSFFPRHNHSAANVTRGDGHSYKFGPFVMTPLIVISLVGFVGNIFLLVAHEKDPLKCFRNTSTFFIHHIAIGDCLAFVFSFVHVALAHVSNGHLYFKSTSFPILEPFFVFFVSYSTLMCASLALERFSSAVFPLFHQVHATKRSIRFWIGGVWIASVALVGIHLIGRHLMQARLFIYVVACGTSLCVTFGLYAACFFSIKRQQMAFRKNQIANLTRRSVELKLSNERRFLTTIFIVSVLTMMFWVPGFIFTLPGLDLEAKLGGRRYWIVSTVATVFLVGVATFNPFVYLWRLPKYRRTFRMLYCSM